MLEDDNNTVFKASYSGVCYEILWYFKLFYIASCIRVHIQQFPGTKDQA